MIFSGLFFSSRLNLSKFCIKFSFLWICSKNILSIFSFNNFSFSFKGINNSIFSDISIFGFSFGFKLILSIFCNSLIGRDSPTINKPSMELISKRAFSFCGIKIESFSSMNNSGFSSFNKVNWSIDWVLISGLFKGSIIIESISWFIKDSLSFCNKLIKSSCSITWVGLANESNCNLSIFCSLFSGLLFVSINSPSINWISSGDFSFGGKNIVPDISILFIGFGVSNIVIKSICCFWFSFLSKESIRIESTACKNNSSFSCNIKEIPSNSSIIKFLNEGIYGVFSIYKSSTDCFFNGSFSFGNNS